MIIYSGLWVISIIFRVYSEYTDVECSRPDLLINGALEFGSPPNENDKYEEGVQVNYFCKHGYELRPETSKFRVCSNGSWTGIVPYCAPLHPGSCLSPQIIANGNYRNLELADRYKVGLQVEYECKPGYKITGPTKRICGSDGDWYPKKLPLCAPLYLSNNHVIPIIVLSLCPKPPKILNAVLRLIQGKQRSNDVHHDSVYAADCKVGYRDTKNPCVTSYLHCDNGEWKGSVPNCVKADSCFPPTPIDNGIVVGALSTESYPLGYEITYKCQNVHWQRPVNPFTTYKCNDSGCWTPDQLPECYDVRPFIPTEIIDDNDEYLRISAATLMKYTIVAVIVISMIIVGTCIINILRHHYLKTQRRTRIITRTSADRVILPAAYPWGINPRYLTISNPNRNNRSALITVANDNQTEQQQQFLPTYEDVMRQDEALARRAVSRSGEEYLNRRIRTAADFNVAEISTSDNSTDPFLNPTAPNESIHVHCKDNTTRVRFSASRSAGAAPQSRSTGSAISTIAAADDFSSSDTESDYALRLPLPATFRRSSEEIPKTEENETNPDASQTAQNENS